MTSYRKLDWIRKPAKPGPERAGIGALSDLELLERIKEGNLKAFRRLYESYAPRLKQFIGKLVRYPQLVEEVLDDTFLVVWNKADSFKGKSKVSTWIFAIAYRKAMRALRGLDLPLEDLDAEKQPSGDPEPDEAIAQNLLHRVLIRAMADLSVEQRAVVDLTYFHDLSYREIAKILDCPVDTVKTRMFYARRYLRERFEGDLDDWI